MVVVLLGEARQAVAAGDVAAALRALIAAWNARRAPAIADAIDAIGKLATVPPPTGKTAKDRDAAWLLLTDNPAAYGVLLESVAATRGNEETLARLKQLDHDDPRVGRRIADLIETPVYNASVNRTRHFWDAAFDWLAGSGDARTLARARGFVAKWQANRELHDPERERLGRRLAKALPALEQRCATPPVLAADETAALEAVLAAAAARPQMRTAADLLAAIYASPDDDGARTVYMDWLLERDDPRGEFIGLQLARAHGEQTREQAKREKALLVEHMTPWLGALAPKLFKKDVRFERGFLDACVFRKQDSMKPGEAVAGVDEDPSWATVRVLADAVPASDACTVTGLRELRVPTGCIVQLATLKKPLGVEHLVWDGPNDWIDEDHAPGLEEYRWRADGPLALAAFERITVLPRLRHLELRGCAWQDAANPPLEQVMRVARAPCARGLEHLAIAAWLAQSARWLAALATTGLRRLEIGTETEHDFPTSWRAVFARDDAGAFSGLVLTAPPPRTIIPSQLDDVVAGIAGLATDQLVAARVDLPNDDTTVAQVRTALAAAFARQTRLASPVYERLPI